MKTYLHWVVAVTALMFLHCTVMPRQVMDEALPETDFAELAGHADRYVGETVVLGGYVLEVENFKDHTRMTVLQAPLGIGQRPKSKDRSQGRLALIYDGFLDSEVFTRDRQVTVGGRILQPEKGEGPPYALVRLQVRDIHLWPVESETYDPYEYDDWYWPWYRPWFHPWHHRHRHHW